MADVGKATIYLSGRLESVDILNTKALNAIHFLSNEKIFFLHVKWRTSEQSRHFNGEQQ